MDLSYIHEEDWQLLESLHPGAMAFLLRRSLWNEYRHLSTIPLNRLSNWEIDRLEQLSKLFIERDKQFDMVYHVCNDYSLERDITGKTPSSDLYETREYKTGTVFIHKENKEVHFFKGISNIDGLKLQSVIF